MPWSIKKRGSQFCVVKDDGGETVKCHPSRTEALRHMKALYVNVPEARRASMSTSNQTYTIQLPPGTVVVNYGEPDTTLTAAIAPLKPPREWFDAPEANQPTPMTYENDGRVYGHLALWESCHRGFMGGAYTECVQPPRSATEYQQFHLGTIETKEGDKVGIGKITFDTDHAPLTADVVAASRHYDNTGSVGAYVRARNGSLGIWLSGALRSDLAAASLVALRANPLSGDWRSLNHNLELVASLAVPVPGFPIPRSQLALAASADGGLEVSALILPAPSAEEMAEAEPEVAAGYSRPQKRKKKMLEMRLRAALDQKD